MDSESDLKSVMMAIPQTLLDVKLIVQILSLGIIVGHLLPILLKQFLMEINFVRIYVEMAE